ncbi:capsid assembly protein [Flavobacterium phage vB_FspM_immuto_3-5A]|uniref:Capsid assembly protein n=1 Tax=Flavobacterium phage vB_FspM_immuto_2-6A TaxID=2801477 RepID=A0A7T8IWS8_9CAUD|nr:capsid assembly protein [Flavobacterium phage vB_FspM_immuto_2-6A]QQO91876.1 capsid assembly protein [Flavobacterium phage vB_FspM_immuto_2-6A]QQO92114.1 capsid assembly protein [Flavobacterium phage vB_FspM_immuto_3-5A]QQO92352.1 capsid assembly protein [Flavobacterium phage vB_FspM_immuto_13-6C]
MAERNLFNSLQRLFSTDILVRNIGGDELKIADINHIQSTGKYQTNSLLDRFSRLYIYNNKNIFNPNLNYQTLRIQLYSDYEAMDTDPLIASTLDILADESTLKSAMGEVLSIKSSDENIQRVLYNLYYDVLNIEFNLWSWIRNMCKYGDFFLKLEISEKFGVYNVIPYTVYHMVRHEGMDKEDPTKVTFSIDPDGLASSADPNYIPNNSKQVIALDNYEVAHFRLISDTNYLPYGRSYIEPARKIYKQLTLMEDAMLIHRIMRAPEKRMFYINVGAIPPNEVEQFMQKTINNIKKTPYVDPQTGQYNLKFNMQNMMEDFYLPVRGGDTSTRIETTKGLDYDGTNDIEYLRDKMFAALKVPKAYFGFEKDLSGKATLAAEDIRFARTVERLQRIVESELTKIGLVHLYSQGFDKESLVNFEIKLTTPSIIYEQEKVALWKEKVDLATQMQATKLFSSDYIYDMLFDISEDKYNEMRELIREDAKREFRISQIENEGNDPVATGQSFGTPHDLASIYGREQGELPAGYDETKPGRPREKMSVIGTNADPMGGRDRLGVQGMKGGFPSDNENVRENINNTMSVFLRNKNIFTTKKQNLFEQEVEKELDLLNEENIKDLDN